jgi:DNA polymerase I-like protein with 3'-5' exonuclease and polymerase domains
VARPPVVVDFETHPIEPRPDYPPRPVGVAIQQAGRKPRYFAWGHPTKNNATKEEAARVLKDIWRGSEDILFQNAKFDLDVAEAAFGLKLPPWHRVHDTMYLLFLKNPHARTLSLKPSAETYLDMPPEERDAIRDWLIEAGHIKKGASEESVGRNIWRAPGDIVGRYAIGDVVRTLKLFNLLYPELDDRMRVAYDRERRLMPILLKNEREGMHVDLKALRRDIPLYEAAAEKVDVWLRKRLKAPTLNLDSPDDLANALDKTKVFTDWVLTPKSHERSTAKGNMPVEKFRDPLVAAALGYRNRVGTVLSNSMKPWYEMASANGGLISTVWNQVKQGDGNDKTGTRTGRLSCSRFQNIAKTWDDKDDGYVHPTKLGVPELPLVRSYITGDPGQLFLHRDYNQQELRILAHFENGRLLQAYRENPLLDVHTYVGELIREIVGLTLPRRPVKILNFGKVYGMGVSGVMAKLKCDNRTARQFVDAHMKALPDVAELEKSIKDDAKEGEPIRTWGGRLYYVEAPAFSKKFGREMTFEYKLLNYLIQGSAADCTKEAVIRLCTHPRWLQLARFLVTVHDEINSSAEKKAVKEALAIQREVMRSIEFDIPMLSDAKVGTSWGKLESYKEAA